MGTTGNNLEEIGRGRVNILCHNLRERTVTPRSSEPG